MLPLQCWCTLLRGLPSTPLPLLLLPPTPLPLLLLLLLPSTPLPLLRGLQSTPLPLLLLLLPPLTTTLLQVPVAGGAWGPGAFCDSADQPCPG